MATVYRATQTSLNRTVAIKKMFPQGDADNKFIRKVENEARSAASLDHDNIIKIYEFGMDGGAFYIAMEYMDGNDLETLLKDEKFQREIALLIALQALKGLHFAHQQGVIHRDIKPANIFISKTGQVKILDFGLARGGENMYVTSPNLVSGTPFFMSPEQARGDRQLDKRMDIFSIGILLYLIITKEFPFDENNIPGLFHAILNKKEKNIHSYAPTLPMTLARTIHRTLEKEKNDRPSSLLPLIEPLENYFYELGVRDAAREITNYALFLPTFTNVIVTEVQVFWPILDQKGRCRTLFSVS